MLRRFFGLLDRSVDALEHIAKQGDKIVAAIDDLNSAITDLNTSVSGEIAAVTTALQSAQGGNGSVPAADVEAAVTRLQQIKATLDTETAAITTPPPSA